MTNLNKQYDAIVIGTGLGGLSTAAFLAKDGKRVLVLEKHDKPGGFVTSFSLNGLRFNLGFEGLREFSKGHVIPRFLRFWGCKVKTKKKEVTLKVFSGDNVYQIRDNRVLEDFIQYFPQEKRAIERFFTLNKRIVDELQSYRPDKPPYEMNLRDKIRFYLIGLTKRNTYVRSTFKRARPVLKRMFKDKHLINVILSKGFVNVVYMVYAYLWEVLRRQEIHFPLGGMQAVPDAIVGSIKDMGSEVLFKREVTKIQFKDGMATGVECSDGSIYYSKIIVSNACPHFTLNQLAAGVRELEPLRKKIRKRKVFSGCMINFLGIDSSFNFDGVNHIVIMEEDTLKIKEDEYTPQNCLFHLIILDKPEDQKDISAVLIAPIPYHYKNNWGTKNTGERGEEYKRIKEEANQILIERITRKLGDDFKKAIKFSIASTPLTSERLTYNQFGSFLGWSVETKHFINRLPPITPVKNLFLVGKWIFPGFGGVAAVMVGGYYTAKRIINYLRE
jgi:phytoene dehydrogenase-like protein